jgi:F-type H+-transporting ATPase subunit b
MSLNVVLAAGGLIDPNPGLAIWTLITFLLVAAFLRWKVWGPLMAVIDEREKSIQSAIDQAKTEREAAEKLLAEQQVAAEAARKEAAEMVRKNRAEVDAAKVELIAKARAEADALVASARKQIEDEKRKALAEVRQVAVDLALAAAGKVVSAKMDDAAHRAVAEEYIGSLGKQPSA